jgi:hypothetical protein
MNRNNRLYTIDASGTKHFTAAGLLLQFWILSEGGGEVLDSRERLLARRVFDNVIDARHDGAAPAHLNARRLASEMNDGELMQIIDTIEEACNVLGAATVYEIIYRPHHEAVH